jgi:hypothetical protein
MRSLVLWQILSQSSRFTLQLDVANLTLASVTGCHGSLASDIADATVGRPANGESESGDEDEGTV